jgi:hypothetical protein
MINCGRAVGPAGVVFPVIVFLLGTFFITNLFLAMLVDSFLEGEDETKPAEVQPGAEEISKAESGRDKAYVRNTEMRVPIHDEDASDSDGTHIHTNADLSDGKIVSKKLVANSSTALYLIGSQTLNHEFFEVGITILVCVSCVSLALDNPLNDPSSVLSSRLYYIDLVITIIFTAEMLLKILVFGAFQKRGSAEAYFRDGLFLTHLPSFVNGLYYCSDHMSCLLKCTALPGWDVLDFIVVVVSLLSTFSTRGMNIGMFRALRALRPLKIIQRIPGLRVIVHSLALALPSVAEVGVIVLMVFFIFGIFFTNYFYGQLRSHLSTVTTTYSSSDVSCLNLGRASSPSISALRDMPRRRIFSCSPYRGRSIPPNRDLGLRQITTIQVRRM